MDSRVFELGLSIRRVKMHIQCCGLEQISYQACMPPWVRVESSIYGSSRRILRHGSCPKLAPRLIYVPSSVGTLLSWPLFIPPAAGTCISVFAPDEGRKGRNR